MENFKNINSKNVIQIKAEGEFKDINKRYIPYSVIFEMPYCIKEWLMSNIKNRYILDTIKKGYEYKGEKKIRNTLYDSVEKVMTINIKSIKDTGKIPTFYGKSIFDFTYSEIQDFSVAFGIHQIPKEGIIEDLRQEALFGYLKEIKGMTEEEIKQLSFYKYDKKRMNYYIEFDENDKRSVIIKKYKNADTKEFEEKDIESTDKKKLANIMFEEDEEQEDKNNKVNYTNYEEEETEEMENKDNKKRNNNRTDKDEEKDEEKEKDEDEEKNISVL